MRIPNLQRRKPSLPTSKAISKLPDFNPKTQELPSSQIASLPATFTNSLLAYAAARDPYINSILAHQYDLKRARERARIVNFSQYSQKAEYLLNTKYARLSGSKVDIMISMVTASNDEIGHHARNDSYEADEMQSKLFEAMTYFDEHELAQLDEEGLTERVRELITEANGYCIYERLNEVVDMLEGGDEEGGVDGEQGG